MPINTVTFMKIIFFLFTNDEMMKKIISLLLFLLLIFNPAYSKILWNENNNIYSTKHNYKIGDTLKIIFNEKTLINYQISLSEENKITTTTKAGQGLSINFLPDLSSGDNFQTLQKSSTKNKGILSKRITAQITKILNNGNLQITGSHSIKINDTLEKVSIKGIVNPKLIKNKRQIFSTDVINPSISYYSKIIKPDIVSAKDYIQSFSTNISVVSGKTQVNITKKYELSEQKKNKLIIKYLNKILSVLFKK